jgi:hypothetical protein
MQLERDGGRNLWLRMLMPTVFSSWPYPEELAINLKHFYEIWDVQLTVNSLTKIDDVSYSNRAHPSPNAELFVELFVTIVIISFIAYLRMMFLYLPIRDVKIGGWETDLQEGASRIESSTEMWEKVNIQFEWPRSNFLKGSTFWMTIILLLSNHWRWKFKGRFCKKWRKRHGMWIDLKISSEIWSDDFGRALKIWSDFLNSQITLLKFADHTSWIRRSHFSNSQITLLKFADQTS